MKKEPCVQAPPSWSTLVSVAVVGPPELISAARAAHGRADGLPRRLDRPRDAIDVMASHSASATASLPSAPCSGRREARRNIWRGGTRFRRFVRCPEAFAIVYSCNYILRFYWITMTMASAESSFLDVFGVAARGDAESYVFT